MTDQPGRRIDLDPAAADEALDAHNPWTRGAQAPELDERVEFAARAEGVLVRDPRYPQGPQLRFSPEQWTALLTAPRHDVIDARTPQDILDLRESGKPSYS